MELEPLPGGTIREFLDLSHSSWYMLTLTDGKSLPFEVEGYRTSKDVLSARPGYLESATRRGLVVYVPLDRIAGLDTLLFEQKEVETPAREGEAGYVNKSAAEILFDCLLENAYAMGFLVEHHMVHYSLVVPTSQIKYTDVTFLRETSLYTDWQYIQRISGGITGIGVGGISLDWITSLDKSSKKKLRKSTKSLDDVCSEQKAVVVKGFVTFLDGGENGEDSQPKGKTGLWMEGANWVQAAISSKKPDLADNLTKMSWQLIHFRDDAFGIPMKSWDDISQPIRVFSEVIPVKVETPMGTRSCYLKARVAFGVP